MTGSSTMQQVQVAQVGTVTTVETAIPEPGPTEVRVRTLLAGICGSDTHAVAGQHPLLTPPYVPGHEAVGTVDALGSNVTGVQIGDRVVVKPNLVCGNCVNCQADRSNACEQLVWIGCDPTDQHPGAMADQFVAPADSLYVVPPSVSDEQAALVECLATPIHAARIVGLADARVIIIGAGTIGALAIIAAREAGAARIAVSDLDPGKRERALRIGADAALDANDPELARVAAEALNGPADVIIDCVAAAGSARQWPTLIRKAGTVAVVGVPARDYELPMPVIQDSELRVQGCASYTEADFAAALALAERIPAAEIVTGGYGWDDAATAFAEAKQPAAGKVLIGPAGRTSAG